MGMKQVVFERLGLVVCVGFGLGGFGGLGSGLGGCASTRGVDELQHEQAGQAGQAGQVGQVGQAGDRAGVGSGSVVIEGASYREVFEAAREVLGAYRFAVDRVDATRGVITTFPKRTLGVGSIWDREQSSLGQEWEDFANQHERTVRVEFESAEDARGVEVIEVVVEVVVHRVHRPNWRVESESVRLSTYARSRDAMGQLEPGAFREPIGHDLALADRIVSRILRRFE